MCYQMRQRRFSSTAASPCADGGDVHLYRTMTETFRQQSRAYNCRCNFAFLGVEDGEPKKTFGVIYFEVSNMERGNMFHNPSLSRRAVHPDSNLVSYLQNTTRVVLTEVPAATPLRVQNVSRPTATFVCQRYLAHITVLLFCPLSSFFFNRFSCHSRQ